MEKVKEYLPLGCALRVCPIVCKAGINTYDGGWDQNVILRLVLNEVKELDEESIPTEILRGACPERSRRGSE